MIFLKQPILFPLLNSYLTCIPSRSGVRSLEQRRDVGVSLEEGRGERSASRGHAQVLTRTGRAAVRATRQQKLNHLKERQLIRNAWFH
jgi:hypothetical protein